MSDPQRQSKPVIAVVFGGRSSEHVISCATAGSVLQAIDSDAYDVVPVGIATDGRWVLPDADPEKLRIVSATELPSVPGDATPVALTPGDGAARLTSSPAGEPPQLLGNVDVVFPLLHGPWGEDGTLQGMLEMSGVRYVGAGVLASAISMDKAYMKVVLTGAGLPTMPSVVVTAREWKADEAGARAKVAELGYPVFVKPARAGSSMGISKVHDASELEAAIIEAQQHDPKVLVEAFAEGAREIECGVLGRLDGGADTSVPAEIKIGGDHEFYDFAAKYLPEESTQLDVPADLPDAIVARVQELSVGVFEAMGCEGLARVDFFLMPDGSLVVNEINTMPGFTPTSMYPRMWAASGVSYPELVERLIALALARDTGLR
ncbi:D-alanine--D-alanine ligase family protein [Nocardioides sp. Bht2]|uniref:D-alanine--D-alanine ligase family protein n=1 Tax=Nocardioides sp. Bht2 TaxID=3392297 RepID=UPI0039B3C4B6